MARTLAALVIVVAMVAPTAAAADEVYTAEQQAQVAEECVGTLDGVTMETIDVVTVDGSSIRACLAYQTGATPDLLVTFTHGNGHYVQASWAPHIERVVAAHGVIAVAMNYRDNFGFPAMRGAEDTIEVTKVVLDRFASVESNVLFSVSMGVAVGGTTLSEVRRLNADETIWTHWIVVEGVTNLFESYAEAALVGQSGNEFAAAAAAGMEHDTGGTPDQVPEAYAARSPLLRVNEYAGDLSTVAVIHAPADGLVGFHQGASLAAALCAAGRPTAFDIVATGSGNRDDTTLFDLLSAGDANDSSIDLAGHGSEADETHPVMAQGFARLDELLSGGVYDTGCASAIGAAAISRPVQTAPTTTTTSTTTTTVAPAALTATPTLPATGRSAPLGVAALLIGALTVALSVRRRALA